MSIHDLESQGCGGPMRCRIVFSLATLLLCTGIVASAQDGAGSASSDAFWVDYWARPRVILFGPEEENFYQHIKDVMFPRDGDDNPINPDALDNNIQWLKDHPSVRLFVEGYASSRGELIYNLALSQRRADWVKQALVSRGIPENRIALAVGWGQLYPVCPELTDECWNRNKLVRFVYSPK
jgi:outer membrane protein OmpA-like peptidoglycan-associated protein